MTLGEKLKYYTFVALSIGTGVLLTIGILRRVESELTHNGYWKTIKSLKPDVKSAAVIKKPIPTPFKSDDKSATVIRKRIWTPFKKIQADSIPPLDSIIAIQLYFKLESDDKTIPLMIRTAASANGRLASKVVGSSGTINQLISEKQTFYVSVSHPSIKYQIKVLGYIEKPQSSILKRLP